MKSALIALVAVVCLAIAAPAHAWNCSDPTASRVDVGSTKPAGATAGDSDGQYYIGSDAAHPNDYYVCEVPKPPTNPSTGGNSNASSTSNSTANSSSQAASNSQSSASATGGKSISNAKATGGNATGGNASSGVSNSGNSSVTNNVAASGGQGGAGGQGGSASATGGNQKQNQKISDSGNSTASASGNGVGNGNNSNDTTINEPREVASAYAPSMNATAQCFKPFSGGGQGLLFGASFGSGKIDENCARLEASRQAPSIVARCKVFITSKYAKEAHVTLDDCLPKVVVLPPAPIFVPALAIAPAPSITVNVPPTQVTVIVPPAPTPAPSVAAVARAYGHAKPSCTPKTPKGTNPCRPEVVTNDNLK